MFRKDDVVEIRKIQARILPAIALVCSFRCNFLIDYLNQTSSKMMVYTERNDGPFLVYLPSGIGEGVIPCDPPVTA